MFKLCLLLFLWLATSSMLLTATPTPTPTPRLRDKIAGLLHLHRERDYIIIPMWAKHGSQPNQWHLRLRGYVLKRRYRPGLFLRGLLRLVRKLGSDEHAARMQERLQFAMEALHRHPIKITEIQVVDQAGTTSDWTPVQACASDYNAMFDVSVELALAPTCTTGQWISVNLKTEDGTVVGASVKVVGDNGYTVISDVDDTVKASNVLQKMSGLKRMFFLPSEAVPYMPEFYRSLEDKLQMPGKKLVRKPAFFYVTAGPFEMHPTLKLFLAEHNFPPALILPSPIRLRHFFKSLTMDLREYKRSGTEFVMQQFPQRKYILVGDSGQMDSEAYGDVVRMSPLGMQVQCILIRLVQGQNAKVEAVKNTPERFAMAFQGIDPTRWRVFEDPRQLLDVPFNKGVCYSPGEQNKWAQASLSLSVPPSGALFGLADVRSSSNQLVDAEPLPPAEQASTPEDKEDDDESTDPQSAQHPVGMKEFKSGMRGEPVRALVLDKELTSDVLPL